METVTRAVMRETCRLCNEPAHLETDHTQPTKVYYHKVWRTINKQRVLVDDEESVRVAGKPSVNHSWNLCYYHKKVFEGQFDLKYPLYKYELENTKLKANLEMLRRSNRPMFKK